MPFRVVWHQTALEQLAEIWLSTDDRERVTEAAQTIDRKLSQDPEANSARVGDEMQVHRSAPLEVLIDLFEKERLVVVVTVVEVRPDRN
jgi:hypothetical protein